MDKLTDFDSLPADQLSDDTILYAVQSGDDYQLSVGALKAEARAAEADTVHKTGTESISGPKTFTSSPQIPPASQLQHPVTKAQLQEAISTAITGGVGQWAPSVEDLDALRAIPFADCIDGQTRLVEAAQQDWGFESSSTAPEAANVVRPTDLPAENPGRWLLRNAATQNHESLLGLQGGAEGDHQHLTAAQVGRIPSPDITDALTGTGTPSASNKFVTQNSLPTPFTGVGKRLVRTADSGTGLVEAPQLKVSPSILQIVGETSGENDVVEGYTGNVNGLSNAVYHSDTNTGAQFSGFRAAGTKASPAPIALGQRILSLFGAGYNSLAFKAAAAIRFIASENWTPTANGTKIVFYTQKNGTVADGALTPKAIISDAGQLAVGGDLNPDPSALFELQSTNQGSLFAPKMTQAQRDAIQSPAQALTIYNTNTDQYEIFDGTNWNSVGSGAGEVGTIPLAVAPSGTDAIEIHTLTFNAATAQQFFALRFQGHSQLFEFHPTASNAALKTGIDNLLAAIPELSGITCTVTGSLTGTATKTGTKQIVYSDPADIPPLQVLTGTVRQFLVTNGDQDSDYSADGGAPFNLDISLLGFQTNQQAVHPSVLCTGSSSAGGTVYTLAGCPTPEVNATYTPTGANQNGYPIYKNPQNYYLSNQGGGYWTLKLNGPAVNIGDALYFNYTYSATTPTGTTWKDTTGNQNIIAGMAATSSTSVGTANYFTYFPVTSTPSAPTATGTDATNTTLVAAQSPATTVATATTQQGSALTEGNDGLITALDKAHLNQFAEDGSLSVPELRIGDTPTPDTSALFELQSNTQGSLFAPKLTTSQRDDIATPAAGLTIYNTDLARYQTYNGTLWGDFVPLAVAPAGAGAIETQTLTFTAAPAQQFFALRFTGHTQFFQFQPTATNATLKAGIDTLLAAIPGLESITSTVTGSVTGTATKSGTKQIVYSTDADIPPLQVISGAVRHFAVDTGDTDSNYSADGGAPFALGITQADFQANQRAIDSAHSSVVCIGSSEQGPILISAGKTASATVGNRVSETFDGLVEGDNGWYAEMGYTPKLGLDLGEALPFKDYRINFSGAPNDMVAWVLKGSNTALFGSGEILHTVSDYEAVEGWALFTRPTTTHHRYIWFEQIVVYSTIVQIREVEFWSDTYGAAGSVDFTTGATWTGSAENTSSCWDNNFATGMTGGNVVDMRLDVGAQKTLKRLKLYSPDQNADKLTIQTRVEDAYWQDGEGDDIQLLSSVDIVWETDPDHPGLYVATFDLPANTNAGRFYRVYPYSSDTSTVTIREIEMFESAFNTATADFTIYFPVTATPTAPSATGTDATNTTLVAAQSLASNITAATTQQGSLLGDGNDGIITALDKAHLNQFDEDGSLSVPGPLKINSDDAGEVGAIPGYPGNVNGIANVVYNGDTNTGAQFGGFRAAGPSDAPTAIEQNQRILSLFGAGHDGESFKATAAIRLLASQDWTPTANGSKIAFYTQQNDTIADGALSAKAVLSDQGQLILGGTLTPDPSALFELQSDTKGSLFAPKMTAAQRDAIPTPTDGLTIYNTDESSYQTYDGTTWTSLGSGGTGASITTVSTPDDLAGLKLWLRRATATPTTWDDAKTNHDATITSGAINAEGVQFDGFTTYASGSATALPSGDAPRTLFTSFRPAVLPSAGNSQVLFFYGAPSGNNAQGLGIGNYGDGTYWVSYFDYITDIEVVAPLYTGQTYTLAGTYDGTTAKIYFNGTLAKTVSRPDWNTTSGGNYRLGGLPTSDPTFNGTIAETLVYNRDLTASEVAALHALTTTAGAGSGAGGNKTLTIAANGLTSPLNLTASQVANTALIFTGNRTAPLDLIPPTPTALTIKNSTTGGHPIQFRPSPSSPKISIGPAETWQLFTDGTDVWGKKLDLAALLPSDISGQFLWLKADSLGLLDGAQVATWNDSSGNNNHATQEDDYYQPTYVANVLNGKPAVRFNGYNQYLAISHNSSLTLTGDFAMFIVYKVNNDAAIITKRNSDAFSNWGLMTGGAGNIHALRFATVNDGVGRNYNSTMGETGYKVFSLTHNDSANELRFYLSGVADSSNPFNTVEDLVADSSPLYIGCQFTGTGVNSPLNGDILEFIGYNRLLTNIEQQGIESYLSAKYAL